MQINVDLKKLKKEEYLSLPEYLILLVLYNNPEVEIDYYTEKMLGNMEDYGYIRIIDKVPHLEPKALNLLEDKLDVEAKEIMDYFNKLKVEYLNINRVTPYRTHSAIIKARLYESKDSIDEIKNMLDYMFKKWHKDYEMKRFLRPQTLFLKSKFDNYMDMAEMDENIEEIKQSTMV